MTHSKPSKPSRNKSGSQVSSAAESDKYRTPKTRQHIPKHNNHAPLFKCKPVSAKELDKIPPLSLTPSFAHMQNTSGSNKHGSSTP